MGGGGEGEGIEELTKASARAYVRVYVCLSLFIRLFIVTGALDLIWDDSVIIL